MVSYVDRVKEGALLKKKVLLALRIFVSFGLLGGLIWFMRKDAKSILDTITACDKRYIVAALGVFVCNSAALAYRMKIVFHGENLDISFKESMQLTYLGYFFNNFMPTAVGGDIVKAHLSVKSREDRMRSYASVMMDRLIGLSSFLILAAVALLVDGGRFQALFIKPIVFSLLALGLVLFVVITHEKMALKIERFFGRVKMGKLGDRLESLYKIVHDYRNRTSVVTKALVVSLLSQSLYFVTVYMFFRSLGVSIQLGNIFLVMPVVTFISMIPSIGGLGVREGAMLAFFSPIVGRDSAFAVSILLLFGLFFISFAGGFIYLHWMIFKKRSTDDQTIGDTRSES